MSQGGGSTQTTQTQSIPPWLQDAAQGYLGAAGQVAQLPFQPYTGQRVSDLSPVQRQGIQGLSDLAGGTPYMQAAQDQLTQTLGGGFHNPYAQQGVGSGGQYQFNPVNSGGQFNPTQLGSGGQFNPASVRSGSNPYVGFGDQFNTVMNQGLNDMGRQYRDFTAPDTQSQFVLNGTFGGGDYQKAVGHNEEALANQMQRFTSGMLNDQFNRSGQLAESGLGRDLSAQQFNDQIGNQSFENAAQRGLQAGQLNNQFGQSSFESAAQRGLNAGQFNANLGNQSFESAAQRGLNAGEFNSNLGSQAYENERNRQMSGIGAASGLYGAQGSAFLNALQGGNTERNQYQSLLDSQYQDFNDWRNYPQQQLGIFGNALAPIFGGTPRSTTTDQGLAPTDRVSQGLGIAAIANLLGRGGGSGSGKP